MKVFYLAPVLLGLCLAGCGGGGGDPGTCSGSPEWCAQTGGAGLAQVVSPTPLPAFVRVSDAGLYSTTCPDILAMNGQNEIAARAAANDAYQRGNLDLDGPPKNGVPCDSYFP